MSDLSGWFGNISEISNFKKVVLSLGNNWKDKTYEEFEAFRVSLLRQRVFFQSSLHLCGVLTGSILVALTISDSTYAQLLQPNIRLDFLFSLKINDISAVYVEEHCVVPNVAILHFGESKYTKHSP